MNKIRVLFQGDSITDGNRYKAKEQEWDKNHQMGHSYAYIVNGILGSRNPERNFDRITSYNVCYTKLLRPWSS